jgi:hypothetical protein
MEYKATWPALGSALLLTIAAACAWAVGTYIAAESYDDYVKHQRLQPYYPSETVGVTPEGTPLIAISLRGPGNAETLLDVDRNTIKSDPIPLVAQDAILRGRDEVDAGVGQRHGNRLLLLEHEPNPKRDPDERAENWYFVMNDVRTGRGWLEGYDQRTRDRIGFIGRNGLSAEPPAIADQFAPSPEDMLRGAHHHCALQWWDFFRIYGAHNTTAVHFDGRYPIGRRQCLILDDTGVHLVDFGARTASVLVPGPVESMAAVSQLEPLPERFVIDDPQDKWKEDRRYLLKIRLAVRTNGTVQLFDLVRNEQHALRLPEELQSSRIDLMLLGNGSGVVKTYSEEPARLVDTGIQASKVRLTWFEPDGRITRQEDIEYRLNASPFSAETGWLIGTVAMPEPLVSTLLVGLTAASMSPNSAAAGFSQRLGKVLGATWPGLLLALASGVVACWLLDRHRRRHRLPRDAGWLVFAMLFGLPGYGGYLLHRRWPPLQLAAAPELTGMEIIAA